MAKMKQKKSEKLPKYNARIRPLLMKYLGESSSYKESIEKGYRFFTIEELDDLKNYYKDGLTWDEIDKELIKKGIILKKATFRKYILDGYLPAAISHRKTSTGRVAIFQPDIIDHINFIQYYYKVMTGGIVDEIMNSVAETEFPYYDIIEGYLSDYSASIEVLIADFLAIGNYDLEIAAKKALVNRPDVLKEIKGMLYSLEEKYQSLITPEIEKIIAFLKDHKIKWVELVSKDNNDRL